MHPPFDITRPPPPAETKRARLTVGHTQEQAAATIYRRGRKRWNEFESEAPSARPMPLETFVLYLLLNDLHPTLRTIPRTQSTEEN
jgi:hypothetical protein